MLVRYGGRFVDITTTMLKNALWIFGFTVFILIIFLPSHTTMQDLWQKNLEYDQQIQLLKKNQDDLKAEKRLLEEDPVYLEKVAREKMGLIKEGEVVYKILPVNKEAVNSGQR